MSETCHCGRSSFHSAKIFWQLLLLTASVLLASGTIAADEPARNLEKVVSFDIKPQHLDVALLEFASQANLQVLFSASEFRGQKTQGMQARLTAAQALTELLQDTGLVYEPLGENTVAVTPAERMAAREEGKDRPLNEDPLRLAEMEHSGSAMTTSERVQEPGNDSRRSSVIQEVTVTAEKAGRRTLLETPLSVSAFTGETLENSGASSMVDVLQSTPGVSVLQIQPGQNMIQIRGISSIIGDSTTGYYIDDLPFSLINLQYVPDVNPFDLERVEVLRGPQGTLYGASSEGGTIRMLTNNADPRNFDARAALFSSNTHEGGINWGGQAVLNAPLIEDRLAVRLTADYSNDNGYIDNPSTNLADGNDATSRSLRGKLTLHATDDLEIRGMAWVARHRTDLGMSSTDEYQRPVPIPGEFYDSDLDLYNVAFDYTRPWGSLYASSSVTHYDTSTLDGAFGFPNDAALSYKGFNQEVRYSSALVGPLQLTGGLYYQRGRQDLDSAIAGFVSQDDTLRSEQSAVFSELRYALSEQLRGTIGLRYFTDDREVVDGGPGTVAVLQSFGIETERQASFHKTTPRFNLSYATQDGLLAYVNVAQGFRSGLHQLGALMGYALSLGQSVPTTVLPEDVWSYETGMKVPLLQNTLSLEIAAYYNDWSDLQVSTTAIANVMGSPLPFVFIQNAGSAHAVGADINVVYSGIRGLTLQLGGNVNDSVYDEDLPGLAGIQKGDRIANVPQLTLSAAADYTWALGGTLRGILRGNVQHSSKRNDYFAGTTAYSDALTFLSLRAGVENDRWGAFLTGENLLGEDGRIENLSALVFHQHPRPRTVGVTAQFRY